MIHNKSNFLIKFILLLFAFTFSISTYSQSLDYDNGIESIKICNAIQGKSFSNERVADAALNNILSVIGASKRFVLQECSNINNAIALTFNGVRYIMYDPEFMKSLSRSDKWSNMFILAHEVGHHINGHTVDALASNSSNQVSLPTSRTQELEADEFAGFVLGRLGADLSDALSGVELLSDEDDTYSTHPRRSKRIEAIKKGFNESGGYSDPSGYSLEKGETVNSPYSNITFSGVKYVRKELYGGFYSGTVDISTGVPFGYGEWRQNNGILYTGEWADGEINGYGKMVFKDGCYEGYFVNNSRSGEGIIVWNDGSKEVGTFSEGYLIKGSKIIDGGTTEGTFLRGDWIMKAKYTDSNGNTKEIGFLDGSEGEGHSTYTYWDGTTVKSVFVNGLIKGTRGFLNLENGYKVSDRSKLSKKANKSGFKYGVMSYIPKYMWGELNFRENMLKVESIGLGYTRDDFSYDHLGYGTMTYKNGGLYKGYFRAGTRYQAGYGEATYPSDDERESYSGIWWDGDRNGYGKLIYKDGRVEKGVFRNNEFFKEEDFDLELMKALLKDF